MRSKILVVMTAVVLMPIVFTSVIHRQLKVAIEQEQHEELEPEPTSNQSIMTVDKVEEFNAFEDEFIHKQHIKQIKREQRVKQGTVRESKQVAKNQPDVKEQSQPPVKDSSTEEKEVVIAKCNQGEKEKPQSQTNTEGEQQVVASRGDKRTVPSGNTSMKTYMSYRAITNTSSKQYKLQQNSNVYTDSEGFRKLGDKFMVAVGTYYGTVGTELAIELSNGAVFEAIISDIKANQHTDKTNRQHTVDGSVVEFIVDTKQLNRAIKKMGDCSYSSAHNFKGNVANITVLSN